MMHNVLLYFIVFTLILYSIHTVLKVDSNYIWLLSHKDHKLIIYAIVIV